MVQGILNAHARAVELLKQRKQGDYPSNPTFKKEFLQNELGIRAGIVELNHPHVRRITVMPNQKRSTVIEIEKIPRANIEARLQERGYRVVRTKFRGEIVTAVYDDKKLGHLYERGDIIEMELKKGAAEEVIRTIFSEKCPPPFHKPRPVI